MLFFKWTYFVYLIYKRLQGLFQLGTIENDGKIFNQAHVLVEHLLYVDKDSIRIDFGYNIDFLGGKKEAKVNKDSHF